MKSINLESPLFYNNHFALRFELGPANIELWADEKREIINKEYFDIANSRALSIFKSAFQPSDEIKLSYQLF